jgi:hypothetical protein
MCFRIAVRAVEAWLLADRERVAQFLGVRPARVPHDPDGLDDPKEAVVNLARQSRRHAIRNELVPSARSGRRVGPLYTARMIEFVGDEQDGWRPEFAAKASNSLARCLKSLPRLPEVDA